MDIELRNSYHQAISTFAPCEIVKCFKVAHRLGQSTEIAEQISMAGISYILSSNPFPANAQETIRLFSWLEALRKDFISVTGVVGVDEEFLLPAYLKYLKIPYTNNDSALSFISKLRFNFKLRENLNFSITSRKNTIGARAYYDIQMLRDNADSEDFHDTSISLENVIRILSFYVTPYHSFAIMGEFDWIKHLSEFDISITVLSRGPNFLDQIHSNFELRFQGQKFSSRLIDNRMFIYSFIENMEERLHPGPTLVEANTSYDVYRFLNFKLTMEQFVQQFRTLNNTRVPRLSNQIDDQYTISRYWYPYNSKFKYALKIENNFGECETGFKIFLFTDNNYSQSEFVVLQHPIGIFRNSQEVLSYIQKRDTIIRGSRKHSLNLKQLFTLAKEIGAKYGYGEEVGPKIPISHTISLIDDPKIHDFKHINFAGYMLRPTWRRYRVKGKLGIKIVPTYIVEAGHTSGYSYESPPEYEIVRIGFADKPEDAIQIILDTIENERLQAESEANFYEQQQADEQDFDQNF